MMFREYAVSIPENWSDTSGILFFFTDFSGLNAVVVALTSAVMFWLPELLALVLVGLAFLQGRIADAFI